MRARWLVPIVLIALVLIGTRLVLRNGLEGPSSSPAASPASAPAASPATDREDAGGSPNLSVRRVAAGAIEITIEPIRIDGTAAAFRIVMDTHSEELSADLASTAVLEVGGVEWRGASWSGDPPGGHHRAGELTFEAAGPPAGRVVLTIGGFAAPVEVGWTLAP